MGHIVTTLRHRPKEAVSFDGVSGYASSPSSPAFNFGDSDFTIEFWGNINKINTNGLITHRTLGAVTWWRVTNSSTGICLEVAQNYPTKLATGTVINTFYGKWAHYAFVMQKLTNYHIFTYVNGVLVGDVDTGYTSLNTDASFPLEIGRYSTFYTQCNLNELRLWGVARTQTQIQANMNARLTGQEVGLQGYWRLNEGAGITAFDKTVNANNGTITGASWVDGGVFYS